MDPFDIITSSCNIYKKFNPQWKEEPDFAKWLQEVPNEPEKFYCSFCDRKYCGNKAEIKKHFQSRKHQKIEKSFSDQMTIAETMEVEKSNEFQKKFRLVWMDDPNFKSWLLPVPHESDKFECCYCDTKYIGGKSEIVRHFKSSKHQKMMTLVNTNDDLKEQYELYVERSRSELQTSEFVEEPSDTVNKHRFRDELLLESDFKDWLIKVNDLEMFGCKICNQEYSGGKCEMKKHAKSTKHRKNAGELTANTEELNPHEFPDEIFSSDSEYKDENNEEEPSGFQIDWLQIPEFADWLQEVADDPGKFGCRFCRKEFDVSQKIDVENHMKSADHQSIEVHHCYKNEDILNLCKDLLDDRNEYDVEIYTKDKCLKAHRLVLSSCEFFRSIFQSSLHFEIENVIRIHIPDFSHCVVELLLKFLYTGEVIVPENLTDEFTILVQLVNLSDVIDNNLLKVETKSETGDEVETETRDIVECPDEQEILFDNEEILCEEVQVQCDNQSNVIYFDDQLHDSELQQSIKQGMVELPDQNSQFIWKELDTDSEIMETPPKRVKYAVDSPRNVEELRDHYSRFRKRLIEAIQHYRIYGGLLEDTSRKFEVPLEALKRNLKGIQKFKEIE